MKILVSGYGQMGQTLVPLIEAHKDFELTGIYSPIEVENPHPKWVSNLNNLSQIPDVVIDFSHYTCIEAILEYCCQHKAALLVATTGHSDDQMALIKKAQARIPMIKADNTSLGVNVMNKVLKDLTKALSHYDIEFIEKHHNQKLDAPSGTANLLLKTINESLEKERWLHYRQADHKKRTPDEIGVSVIRGGTIAGEHIAIFAGEDEVIEFKHQAFSKKLFAQGALIASQFLYHKSPGAYTMEDVLFKTH